MRHRDRMCNPAIAAADDSESAAGLIRRVQRGRAARSHGLGPSPLGGRSRRTFGPGWADPPPGPAPDSAAVPGLGTWMHTESRRLTVLSGHTEPEGQLRTGACTVLVILGSSSSGEPWPGRDCYFQSCSIKSSRFLLHESQQVPKLSIPPRISQ